MSQTQEPNFFGDLNKAVQDTVKVRNPEVVESLKNKMVEDLLTKRVSLLSSAMTKRKALEGNLRANKEGDIKHFNEDGTVAAVHFSKEKLEKKKQAEQEMKKFDEALDKAVNQADWESLEKLVAANGGDKQ